MPCCTCLRTLRARAPAACMRILLDIHETQCASLSRRHRVVDGVRSIFVRIWALLLLPAV